MDSDAPTRDPFIVPKDMKFPNDGFFITGQLRAAMTELRLHYTGPEGVNAMFKAMMDDVLADCTGRLPQQALSFRRAQ